MTNRLSTAVLALALGGADGCGGEEDLGSERAAVIEEQYTSYDSGDSGAAGTR